MSVESGEAPYVPRIGDVVAVNRRIVGWGGGPVFSPGELGLVVSLDGWSPVVELLIRGERQNFYLGYVGPLDQDK